MDALVALAIQIVLSFVVCVIVAHRYVAPRLSRLSDERALIPLLWVHVLRYLPLTLMVREQVDPGLPADTAQVIALGDLASAVLALFAIVALEAGAGFARRAAWVFAAVSGLDIAVALALGMKDELYRHALGVNWYVLAIYVPLVCVSQVMIVRLLLRTSLAPRAPGAPAASSPPRAARS